MSVKLLLTVFRAYAFPIVMSLMLLIAIVIIGWREHRISEFKNQSIEHTFLIKLEDHCGWREIQAIQKTLEIHTHQDVEIHKDSSNVYKLKVKCPPDDAHSIWHWLSRRQWVKHANSE